MGPNKNKSSTLTVGLDLTEGVYPSPVAWPHRAGSITEYLESFKLRLGSYSHEVKVPFIRAIRTSVRFVLVLGAGIEPARTLQSTRF